MNKETFNNIIVAQMNSSVNLLLEKNDKYAPDDDALHNIRKAAALQCCSLEQACGGFLAKHIISIYDMIIQQESSTPLEVWNEKLSDATNYLLFLWAIVKDKHAEEDDTKQDEKYYTDAYGRRYIYCTEENTTKYIPLDPL